MTAAIACEGLTRRYGGVLAVDSLDLEIAAGEVFGFLGPNGAGKTTTIGMLVGVVIPTAGSARVAGLPIEDGAYRRRIGFLQQEPAIYGWMCGREFLDFIGRAHGLDAALRASRAGELLERFALTDAAGRKVAGYSDGMKKRLALAAALMSDPEILILDEPVNDLDPMGRREILEIIGSLCGDKTVLMSTHVLSDVDRVCTSVGIINQGKLLVNSTIEALRDRHARPVFSIDVEGDPAGLIPQLDAADYVASVRSLPDGLRVIARDEDRARRELPALVVASGLFLSSYRLERPRLEDIFVELVEGDGAS